MARKNYHTIVNVINVTTGEPDGPPRIINYSDENDRARFHRIIFACLHNGQGVTIELDRIETDPVTR